MPLIIVESPAKSKTISKYLGPKYQVLSSYGHIRDLPKNELGIDLENDFQPKYIIPTKARKTVTLLKKAVEKTEKIILACDQDREGEAIAWHLSQALNLDNKKTYQRIVFQEITKSAIEQSLKNPRKIDFNLVNAQQARRVLDRIVGYKLSPFLWKKIARGLSAGRVQSIAVKLVVDREREIEKFLAQEYWTIEADFEKNSKIFKANLFKENDQTLDKLAIKNEKQAIEIIKNLENAEYKIVNLENKETKKNPLPPFITSTLQQTAWQRFKWPAKQTMRIAQQLYETGKITYHRTDSFNLSDSSLLLAQKIIIKNYGKEYWPGFSKKYKTKSKTAQEAHEAIRPSFPEKKPEDLKLDERQFKLYDLIWRRFIASQMSQAIFNSTVVDIKAKNYLFRAIGQTLKFDGFLKIYPMKFKENELPFLEEKDILKLIKLIPSQHFTQPPPRYNEATLIKALEENNIGRPSTYAPILSNVQEKNYIEKDEQKRFQPTEIGTVINDILAAHFPEIVNLSFTAKMEESLDDIAENKKEWTKVIKDFYLPFKKNLEEKYEQVSKKDITEKPTGKICPKCQSPLLIRLGRYGKFYACSKFPECKHTDSLEENSFKIKCPKCQKGQLVQKRTKKRKIFYGCNQYPKCDFALWDKPTGEKCLKCNSLLIETIRKQIKCSNAECRKNEAKDDFQKKSSHKKCIVKE